MTPVLTPEQAKEAAFQAKVAQIGTIPGYAPEFDPEEAERLGCFTEDALTLEDAIEASKDDETAP